MVRPVTESVRDACVGYRSRPDGERWELIHGEAHGMASAPARIHQDVVVELVARIHDALAEKTD